MATTAAPSFDANFTRGEEAINWSLPSKKASSPGRGDRESALPALGRRGARRSSHRRCPYDEVQRDMRLCCRLSSLPLLALRRGDATVQLEETSLAPERRRLDLLKRPPGPLRLGSHVHGAVAGVAAPVEALAQACC